MMVLKTVSLLASVGLAAGNARFMIQDARCSRDVSVGANIMGVRPLVFPFASMPTLQPAANQSRRVVLRHLRMHIYRSMPWPVRTKS